MFRANVQREGGILRPCVVISYGMNPCGMCGFCSLSSHTESYFRPMLPNSKSSIKWFTHGDCLQKSALSTERTRDGHTHGVAWKISRRTHTATAAGPFGQHGGIARTKHGVFGRAKYPETCTESTRHGHVLEFSPSLFAAKHCGRTAWTALESSTGEVGARSSDFIAIAFAQGLFKHHASADNVVYTRTTPRRQFLAVALIHKTRLRRRAASRRDIHGHTRLTPHKF